MKTASATKASRWPPRGVPGVRWARAAFEAVGRAGLPPAPASGARAGHWPAHPPYARGKANTRGEDDVPSSPRSGPALPDANPYHHVSDEPLVLVVAVVLVIPVVVPVP